MASGLMANWYVTMLPTASQLATDNDQLFTGLTCCPSSLYDCSLFALTATMTIRFTDGNRTRWFYLWRPARDPTNPGQHTEYKNKVRSPGLFVV